MTIHFKIKSLIIVALLISFSSFSSESVSKSTEENNNHAPEATAEEAKLKFWSVPEIKRTFWDIPELEKAFIDDSPADRNDGIPVGKLGIDGGNKDMIIKLAQEIADKKHGEVDSMLIAHKGKVLFESYYSRGRIDLSHPQSSTTKGYTALTIGRAIQLGYLTMADLGKPLVSFLKGLDPSKFVKGVEKITLHQAMAMSSGLQISKEKIEEYQKNPDHYTGIKQIQAFFEDSSPVTAESQKFNYKSPDPIMVMQVLEAVVPGSAKDFIKNEIIGKMGINNYGWRNDKGGFPKADGQVSMTSRNMVKLGMLVINKGRWNGVQLLPEAFIKKLTNKNVQLSDDQVQAFWSGDKMYNSGYGYFWFQADMKVGNKNYFSSSAQGGGGVIILSIDELDLLVIITAHSRQAYMQMIAQRILPAFVQ